MLPRTLEQADGDTRVFGGHLGAVVAALKAEPGDDLLLGGGAGSRPGSSPRPARFRRA